MLLASKQIASNLGLKMPEKRFSVGSAATPAPSDRLAREVEQLEVAGKRITNIHYPKLHAKDLGIAESDDGRAKHRGHNAIGTHGGTRSRSNTTARAAALPPRPVTTTSASPSLRGRTFADATHS